VCLAVGREAVGVGGLWQAVAPREGVDVLACRLRSQEPDSGDPDWPLITRRRIGQGTVTAAYGPLFSGYLLRHYPLMRRLIDGLIAGLGIEWLVEVDASARLEVILRRKGGRLMVNLLNRGAGETLSANRVMIDELPPVAHVPLRVRMERPPQSVSLAPAGAALDWEYERGWCSTIVPEIAVHEVVVIE